VTATLDAARPSVPLSRWARRGRLAGVAPTAKELRVLDLVSHGATVESAALELDRSPSSVAQHLMRLRVKLDAVGHAGLVAEGFRLGHLRRRGALAGEQLPLHAAQVLELLPLGLTDRQIGGRLGLHEDGVGSRMLLLMRCLGTSTRGHAIRVAYEAGHLMLLPDGVWIAP
jgi:DNA-binding CsgD family transcriptional regulator